MWGRSAGGETMTPEYAAFIASKAPKPVASGVDPSGMPSHLFDFQAAVVSFLLRQGRGAAFLDTGLGKTACELEWSNQAAEASNGRALILTPLAVARQIEAEGRRWGYDIRVVREQSDVRPGINVCNYDRLDHLDPGAFGAVALDESSILKSFNGSVSRGLINAFRDTRFRLAATATPSPNDHMELGQHSDFLGVMASSEMLIRWFINDTSTASQTWRLKKHGEAAFWDWVASWSRSAASPEDLGFDGSRYILPELQVIRHKVAAEIKPEEGNLFAGDVSATNMHALKRQTADDRAALVADLVTSEAIEPWVIWVDTDYESEAVMSKLKGVAIEVRGSMPIEKKEAAIAAFGDGSARVLVTKSAITGYGLNWQHCARQAFVGRSFSYEAWYQAVRRCWRFGQTRPVIVHIAVAEGEDQIGRVIDRKAESHATMKKAMAAAMMRANASASEVKVRYNPTYTARFPKWLTV
jgi:hypothetical protein